MSDDHKALIGEARYYLTDGGPWRDEVRVAGLVRRLADALEAVSVDRAEVEAQALEAAAKACRKDTDPHGSWAWCANWLDLRASEIREGQA